MIRFQIPSTNLTLKVLALAALGISSVAAPMRSSGPDPIRAPSAVAPAAGPTLITENLTSNRFSSLPNDTLQLTLAYDGNVVGSGPALTIYFRNPSTGQSAICQIDSAYNGAPISDFLTKIHTFEFDLAGFEPTGFFRVDNTVGNGVIDGLAFGLFWKDALGNYRMLQSNADVPTPIANYWGMWPVSYTESFFTSVTPQLGGCPDGDVCRAQARSALWGAKFLMNGTYLIGAGLRRI